MLSERMQRQVDRLLDECEEAVSASNWTTVGEKATAALAIDENNGDARAFLRVATSNGFDASRASSPDESPDADVQGAGSGARTDSEAGRILPAPLALPTSFASGRYRVIRFLGEGGKKRVFLAHDELLDRDVAFALIKTDGLDDVGRERVTREAQAMGRLGAHPHVVSIFDLGEHERQPFIVTEFMGGGDVEGLLKKADGPLPVERSLEIAKAVCRALLFAHDKGVVHRDLKPGNVWLTADGTAKIGDFGLAVAFDRTRLTQQGMMVGTASYMPPEQALGGEVTPQSDLYSLGAMLYEMVTGHPPFAGSDPTAVISQHINTQPVAPSWLTEHCPSSLEELILRLLAKAPGQRPASAQEVLKALEGVDPTQKSAAHSDSSALERLARGLFVGREQELEKLTKAFDEAFAGRGSLVMLVGEPGIGKTRTAQELETYARMRGAQVFWGRSHEAAGAPAYWPWVQVGRAFGATTDVALLRPEMASAMDELARLFPELRQLAGFVEPEQMADPQSAQFRLFDAYATFLRAVSARSPVVVALDDIHWADKPTLLLLQHVARELSHVRVLVVCGYRDTELSRTHPLSEALATLNREPGFLRISLRGLSREEVAAYIRGAAHVQPSSAVVDRIHEETEGNPFFLSEVVNLMTQEGVLSKRSLSDIAIPEGVKEALGRRLDRVSEDANALLQVAAIVGREFTYDTLTLLAERDEDALLRLIEEGLSARVIEEMDEAGRYRFTHALMQETLLAELSTTRRVRLHGQVGEALERRWGDRAGERANRLARHFGEAATLSGRYAAKAIQYSRLAAGQAEAQTAWAEAARLYEQALTLSEQTEPLPPSEQIALLTSLAQAYSASVDYRGAWRALRRALALCEEAGDDAGYARAVSCVARFPEISLPPVDRIRPLFEEGLRRVPDEDTETRAWLLARLASLAGVSNDEQARLLAEGRALADAHGYRAVQAQLVWAEGLSALWQGKFRRATGLLERSIEDFRALGMFARAGDAAEWLNVAWFWGGDIAPAERAATLEVEFGRRSGERFYEIDGRVNLANLTLVRGGVARFRSFVTEFEDSLNWSPVWGILKGVAALYEGDIARAHEALPEPATIAGATWVRGWAHLVRAWVRCEEGDGAGASAELDGFNAILPTIHEPVLREGLLVEAHEVGVRVDPAAWSAGGRALVQDLPEALRELRLGGAPWYCASRIRASIALSLGMLEDAERLFREGLTWTESAGAVIEEGRCHQGLAEVAERRGEHAEAMAHLDRAGEIFSRTGAKHFLDQVLAKKEILKA